MMNLKSHFDQFVLRILKPFAEQFPIQQVVGNNGVLLAYKHFFHLDFPSEKLIILVNGRAENLLKWTEIAFDFYNQGYDVLVFDHRGQGYSARLLNDSEKGYIDKFSYYIDDMDIIIETVQSQFQYKKSYIIAHSMGALITTFYLAKYPHRINKAVFSAPLFQFLLKHSILDEIIINLMNLIGFGKHYVFGKTVYKPKNLILNELSHSKVRMRWINLINRKYPKLQLGGPTFRWVHLCLNSMKKLPKAIKSINIPVLIFQADKEKIVCNDNLLKLIALFMCSKVKTISNAKHEILFECDEVRRNVIMQILTFFKE